MGLLGSRARKVAAGALGAVVFVACANLDGLAGGAAQTAAQDGGRSADGAAEAGPVTIGAVTVNPSSVDFPNAPCGTPQTAPITLTNASADAVPYSFVLAAGAVISLVGADTTGTVSGVVPAHGTSTVMVSALNPAGGNATADIQATIGGTSTVIPASVESAGAVVSFQPAVVDFGQVRENQASAPIAVTVRNDGNDAVTLGAFEGAADFTSPFPVTLQARSTLTVPFTLTAGTAGPALDEKATPGLKGSLLCGAVPTLELKGQRVSTTVTVNPGTVDFGTPACGSTGTVKTLTISNYSPVASVPYSATLPTGSKFSFAGMAAGTVPMATGSTPGTATVTVQLTASGSTPGDVTDALAVTVNPNGGDPTVFKTTLHAVVTGALVTVNPTSASVPDGVYEELPVTNAGNVTVCLAYRSDNASLELQSSTATVTPSANGVLAAGFERAAVAGSVGHVTMSSVACNTANDGAPAPVCGALPVVTLTAAR